MPKKLNLTEKFISDALLVNRDMKGQCLGFI